MKIKKYGIYHINKKDSGLKANHDVVVLNIDKKKDVATYKNVTSLQYIKKKTNEKFLKVIAINNVKKGIITALPDKALSGIVWSGVYNKVHQAKISKLKNRKFCDNEFISRKYRKHVT